MSKIRYAQLTENSLMVKNVIIGSKNLSLTGFTLIALDSDKYCEPGMYYDRDTGEYYFDELLTQKEKAVSITEG